MNQKSLEYKKYKKLHGSENHSFITSYVGLCIINSKDDKPDNLSTSWNPKNIEHTKNQSKLFIQSAAVIYSVVAFEEYLTEFVKHIVLEHNNIDELNNVYSEHSLYNKIYRLGECYPILKTKEFYLAIVSIFWRNELVHKSNKSMPNELKGNLRAYKAEYLTNYCDLDIDLLIEHFDNFRVPTFKETISIMTNLRRFAENIDNFFMKQIDFKKYVTDNLRNLVISGKIKRFDINNRIEKRERFWTNVLQINLGFDINEEFKKLDVWKELLSIKNIGELETFLKVSIKI